MSYDRDEEEFETCASCSTPWTCQDFGFCVQAGAPDDENDLDIPEMPQ